VKELEEFCFWVLFCVFWQKFADITKECDASIFMVEE
jgi:hypothetical protein